MRRNFVKKTSKHKTGQTWDIESFIKVTLIISAIDIQNSESEPTKRGGGFIQGWDNVPCLTVFIF